MPPDSDEPNERTPLVPHNSYLESLRREHDAQSIISSHVSKEEQALGDTALGERLPYNDYTTIDWLHDLVRSITLIMILTYPY